jgi:membrane protein involved in colicin uptake
MKRIPGLAIVLLLAALPAIAAAPEPDVMTKLFEAQLKLAKSGDANAYFHVGEMYEKGLGTAQNLDEARSWYAKAADKGQAKARDKLAKWKQIESERVKAADRAAARERQVEEARQANEARERAARAAAEERARLEAQAKARAAQETARLQAMQQAKAAAEARARVELEARRHAEAAAAARAEAAKKAANDARAAGQKTAVKPEVGVAGTSVEADGNAEAAANPPADEKRVMSTAAPGTPIQAIISRKSESDMPSDAAGTAPGVTPSGQTADDKRFSANPCNSPTAKFLSTCR